MNVLEKIFQIMNEQLQLSEKKFNQEDMDKDLFGLEIRLCARDLMVLFCEIEKTFNIKITEEKFEKYGFRTIRDISILVQSSVSC